MKKFIKVLISITGLITFLSFIFGAMCIYNCGYNNHIELKDERTIIISGLIMVVFTVLYLTSMIIAKIKYPDLLKR